MNYALIFAGGSGTRMNTKAIPKQFLKLFGKEIIIHTLEVFQFHQEIDGIIIVCIESWIEHLWQEVKKNSLNKVLWIVSGGKTGQESIFNGLTVLSKNVSHNSTILIHDGVRPFVSDELISTCINSVKTYGSAITVTPSIETIVSVDNNKIKNISDRNECYHAKAPQCFVLSNIFTAHKKAIQMGMLNITDSATLMYLLGFDLYTVAGSYDNIKITTPEDFFIFRALYEIRENSQIFGL